MDLPTAKAITKAMAEALDLKVLRAARRFLNTMSERSRVRAREDMDSARTQAQALRSLLAALEGSQT